MPIRPQQARATRRQPRQATLASGMRCSSRLAEGWSEEATVDESTTAAANDTVFAATFTDDLFAVA